MQNIFITRYKIHILINLLQSNYFLEERTKQLDRAEVCIKQTSQKKEKS